MAPNPASPPHFGPDFRYGCPQNAPGAWTGHQKVKNRENVGKSGVQKNGFPADIRDFLANVRNVPGILFSLLENYLGPRHADYVPRHIRQAPNILDKHPTC